MAPALAQFRTTECSPPIPVLTPCLETAINCALEQTASYMDRCSADEGHLVLFDRERRLWKDKVFRRNEEVDGTPIELWGM